MCSSSSSSAMSSSFIHKQIRVLKKNGAVMRSLVQINLSLVWKRTWKHTTNVKVQTQNNQGQNFYRLLQQNAKQKGARVLRADSETRDIKENKKKKPCCLEGVQNNKTIEQLGYALVRVSVQDPYTKGVMVSSWAWWPFFSSLQQRPRSPASKMPAPRSAAFPAKPMLPLTRRPWGQQRWKA